MINEKLTTQELQETLGKSKRTIFNWREQGMPFHKDKNLVYFCKDEVSEWLKMRAEEEEKFHRFIQESRDISMEATVILSTWNKTADKMLEFELLEKEGVTITEQMRKDYEKEKARLNDMIQTIPEIFGYKDRMKELLTVINFILVQRPVQKDLLRKSNRELTKILHNLEGNE